MNGKMLGDVLLLDMVLLVLGCFFGLQGFLTMLVLTALGTIMWVVGHI